MKDDGEEAGRRKLNRRVERVRRNTVDGRFDLWHVSLLRTTKYVYVPHGKKEEIERALPLSLSLS